METHACGSGARLGTMVRDVVCPREQWLANASADKDLLTSLIRWKIKTAAYRVASGDKISEAVRVATNDALEPTATLCQSPSDQRRSVDALKLWIRRASCVPSGLSQRSSADASDRC